MGDYDTIQVFLTYLIERVIFQRIFNSPNEVVNKLA